MSGDCLEDFLTASTEWPLRNPQRSLSFDDQVSKPMFWPRTMSGDVLDLLAEAAAAVQQPLAPLPATSKTLLPPPAEFAPAEFQGLAARAAPPPPPLAAPAGLPPSFVSPASPAVPSKAPAVLGPKTVSLAAALDEEAVAAAAESFARLGTDDMPTMGSMSHSVGNCKPCAFMHTKGCQNGVNCRFCHLCDPGEKRRRQKEKKIQSRGW
jgi:hypothetical protein